MCFSQCEAGLCDARIHMVRRCVAPVGRCKTGMPVALGERFVLLLTGL